MANVKLKMPYFCKGVKSKLQEALDEGGIFYNLDRIIWDIDPENNHFYFVNTDKVIHEIVGDNEELVKRVDVLPSISEAQMNVLYILNNTVYTFDGNTFYPTYQNVSDDLNDMAQNISNLATSIEDIQGTITEHTTAIETLTVDVATADGKAEDALTQLNGVYTKGEVDQLFESNIGELIDPDTGEKIDVKDYVDATVESAIGIVKI